MKRIAVVGAGVLGRLTALRLATRGFEVTIFDRGPSDGSHGLAAVAAGMLSPACELETAEPLIYRLGLASLDLWPKLIDEFLSGQVFFRRSGSLVVAHPNDRADLERLRSRVTAAGIDAEFKEIAGAEIRGLEPHVDPRFMTGLYFPAEGQIDPRGFMTASAVALTLAGVESLFDAEVTKVAPGRVSLRKVLGGSASKYEDALDSPIPEVLHLQSPTLVELDFDCVIDCRGMGAKTDFGDLRGVRGEVVTVHAPGVRLERPVRLMHPRHPIYVVPRPRDLFLIGATQIESEDESPLSVRSALELLSAAHSLNSAFSEGRIVEMKVGLRPAFPDNLPRIVSEEGLIRANGLYRHGYLLAPKLSELLARAVEYRASEDLRFNVFNGIYSDLLKEN